VRNEEVLQMSRVKEEWDFLLTINNKKGRLNVFGHILCKNCLLRDEIE
jgi:hypothetical protein